VKLGVWGLGFVFLALQLALAALPSYRPLGRTAYLTSSFGEDRGTRYHAGIDFSTNREEGWPVIAPENGVVIFAARGAFGYGRFVKFRIQDKHVWLFAHLSEFTPKIDSLIREEMLKKEKPNVSISPGLRFKKGDTLAYSGSSGIGNPHLHVEHRTPDEKLYLNPCKNMRCTDTIRPLIMKAAPFDTGFAIKIIDYSRKPFDNPMSIYSLDVYQGDEKIFSKRYDTLFSGYKEQAKIKEDLLRVEDPDTARGDWHFINAKIEPKSKIMVVAKDFANNVSRKELALKLVPLKLRKKTIAAAIEDTVALGIGEIYMKTNFTGRKQCRIPVLEPLSGLDFSSVDFRDKSGNWVIFDYHLNTKELFVESRDFDFSEPLAIKMCDKNQNCREDEIFCVKPEPGLYDQQIYIGSYPSFRLHYIKKLPGTTDYFMDAE
jgi:hypothetical protein